MLRNLKRVFADHLFISEKILEEMEKDDWITDQVNRFLFQSKEAVESGACDHGLLSSFKPESISSTEYFHPLTNCYVRFTIFRERCGETIVATLSYADDDESPCDEMLKNRKKDSWKDRLKKIFTKKEAA